MCTMLLNIIAVPFYYKFIGEDGYNLVMYAVAFLAYLNLLDLGLTYSVSLRTTEAAHHDDKGAIVKYQQTGFGLLWPFGITAVLIFVGFGMVFDTYKPDNPISGFPMAYWIVGATAVFTTLSIPLMGLVNAYERYKLASVLRLINSVLLTVCPVTLCWITNSPYGHLGGSMIAWAVTFAAYGITAVRMINWSVLVPKINFTIAKDLLKKGFGMLLLRLPGAVQLSVDRLAIGTLYDASQVDDFAIPARVPEQLQAVYRSTTDPMFPAFTKANQDEDEKLHSTLNRYALMLLVGSVIVILIPCAFARPILNVWVPEQITELSVIVMQIMAWYHLIDMYYTVMGFAVLAKGKAHALIWFNSFSAGARLVSAPLALTYGDQLLGPLPTLALANVLISAVQYIPYHFCVLRVISPSARPWKNIVDGLKVKALAGAVFAGAVATAASLKSVSPWLLLFFIPVFQAAFIWIVLQTKVATLPDAMMVRLRKYGLVRK